MTTAPAPGQPTDPLSIVSLAAGIAALVLTLASVLPLMGMCFGPLSALAAMTALISGLVSVARTTINRELDGRLQAVAGLFLALLWGGLATLLYLYLSRH